jgi:hypothetical protein
LMLAPLVAATPALVPALFGDQWDAVVPVIPPACLHLMVMGSISVALLGYLWAMGEAGAVLRATLVGIPLMFAVMIPLLLVIGVPAVGFGWLASGVGEATVLILTARKYVVFRTWSLLVPPTVFATIAAAAGWMLSAESDDTVLAGLGGAVLAGVVYLVALLAFHRTHLVDCLRLFMRGTRNMMKRPELSPRAPVGEM